MSKVIRKQIRRWQIRNSFGQPVAFVDALSPEHAVRAERESRGQTDPYYDHVWTISDVDGADIRLK